MSMACGPCCAWPAPARAAGLRPRPSLSGPVQPVGPAGHRRLRPPHPGPPVVALGSLQLLWWPPPSGRGRIGSPRREQWGLGGGPRRRWASALGLVPPPPPGRAALGSPRRPLLCSRWPRRGGLSLLWGPGAPALGPPGPRPASPAGFLSRPPHPLGLPLSVLLSHRRPQTAPPGLAPPGGAHISNPECAQSWAAHRQTKARIRPVPGVRLRQRLCLAAAAVRPPSVARCH